MDSNGEKLRLMELELQFQDDNTSCSSSLSTSVSVNEDIDDLRLGAEANTFTLGQDENEQDNKKRLVQNFIIMKENCDTYSREDMNHTFSTISSISDLIDAREADPDDLLLGLGFAPFEGEESHSSILSRFHTLTDRFQELERSRHSQVSSRQEGQSQEAHDGIAKTKEWLANQANITSSTSPTSQPKESPIGTKAQDAANHHPSGQTKRMSSQRKRHRWSKSRQSSFEHLLPNLEEEEMASDVVEKSDNSSGSSRREPPIRESSQEKANFSPERPVKTSPTHNNLHEEELSKKLHKLQKQQGFDHQDAEPMVVTQFQDPLHQTMQNSYVSPGLTDFDKKGEGPADIMCESSPVQFPTLRYLKPHELIKAKLDSFELEEIASNDSRQSPETTIQSSFRSLKSLSTVEVGVLDINANKKCEICLPCHSPQTQDSMERPLSAAVSSESNSDSSSGFDEGLEESLLTSLNLGSCVQDEEKNERACLKATASRFLVDFSMSRAKMACAAGVAEAALRLRKMADMMDISSVEDCQPCHCVTVTKSAGFDTTAGEDMKSLSRKRSGAFTKSLSYSQFSLAMCNCERTSDPVSDPAGGSNMRLFGLSQRRKPPSLNVSLNTDLNDRNSSFRVDRGRLCRYSSMPTLRQAPWSSCHETLWHSPGFERWANPRASTPTLMSSIADVTNLSLICSSRHQAVSKSILQSRSDTNLETSVKTSMALDRTRTKMTNRIPTWERVRSVPTLSTSQFCASPLTVMIGGADSTHVQSCTCDFCNASISSHGGQLNYESTCDAESSQSASCFSKTSHEREIPPHSRLPNGESHAGMAKHDDCSKLARIVRVDTSSKSSNDSFRNGSWHAR